MNSRIRLAVTFTLALAVLQASAFAQAAAESALVGASSSTATVKAGSSLNSALDKGSKQLGARVQRQTSPPAPRRTSQVRVQPVPTTPVKDAAAGQSATPGQGLVVASIQGAATRCAPSDRTATAPAGKTAAESPQTGCSGQDSAGKPAPQKYQSVITLSFTK